MDPSQRRAFAQDGAVLIERFLNVEQLARCRAVYDWCVENPGPFAAELYAGTEKETHNENANPGVTERANELVSSIPFGDLFADLWGSKQVWYFAEEVFLKKMARAAAPPGIRTLPIFRGRESIGRMPGSASKPSQTKCAGDGSGFPSWNSLRWHRLQRSERYYRPLTWRKCAASASRYRGAAQGRPERL